MAARARSATACGPGCFPKQATRRDLLVVYVIAHLRAAEALRAEAMHLGFRVNSKNQARMHAAAAMIMANGFSGVL